MGKFSIRHPFAHSENLDNVPPPDGPPPSYQASSSNNTDYAPPPGPPPGKQPPSSGHDWESVPLPEDTSNYPPPPAIFAGHDRSFANNATEQQAAQGEHWCQSFKLLRPRDPNDPALRGALALIPPQSNTFHGSITPAGANTWTIRTEAKKNNDNTVTAQPPLYAAGRDNPRLTGRAKTVYFEVRLLRELGRDAGVGIGFVALPYPAFRMPGWHRGSLAVHSDDGHRYVNDRWGGNDFVEPWGKKGEVVGIGMTFGGPGGQGTALGGGNDIEVEVFFTRNGRVEKTWDVNEPRDVARDLDPVGVQGFHDLVAAVGSFERTEFEVVMDPGRWAYKGVQS